MQENNKRIAKNTLMLYFRMMLIMGVTLYTSRIVLDVLGIEDFGIYNIVGGVVVMFGFLNSAMSSATQRFLSFEMGRKDYAQLKKVFSLSVTIHALIAVVIFILAETIGLWFLNTQLTIPADRMEAANWVYQFSIFAFMINVMAVPYNAAIISHERMNVYAYVSIIEVILKLAIVFLLQYFGFDKLKLYAILVFVVSFIVRMIYQIYCKRKFEECTYRFVWDRALFHELFSFVGWNFLGRIATIGRDQGANFLLNSFFGVTVNAAMGVATQLSGGIFSLVSNFQTAFRPQLIKLYAEGKLESMFLLIFRASKLSFFLYLPMALMMWINTSFLLQFWLKQEPEYAANFVNLLIFDLLISSISAPCWMSIYGIGKIKKFQLIDGCLLLLNLPFTYLFIAAGFPPETYICVRILLTTSTLFYSIYYLYDKVQFPVWQYVKQLLIRLFTIAIVLLLFLYYTLLDKEGLIRFYYSAILLLITLPPLCYCVGLSAEERRAIKSWIAHIVKSKLHHNNK